MKWDFISYVLLIYSKMKSLLCKSAINENRRNKMNHAQKLKRLFAQFIFIVALGLSAYIYYESTFNESDVGLLSMSILFLYQLSYILNSTVRMKIDKQKEKFKHFIYITGIRIAVAYLAIAILFLIAFVLNIIYYETQSLFHLSPALIFILLFGVTLLNVVIQTLTFTKNFYDYYLSSVILFIRKMLYYAKKPNNSEGVGRSYYINDSNETLENTDESYNEKPADGKSKLIRGHQNRRASSLDRDSKYDGVVDDANNAEAIQEDSTGVITDDISLSQPPEY